MKKSMLNVITLALVLINLILTVLLTFSLVSTNNKTNNLITKVAQIIDLENHTHFVISSFLVDSVTAAFFLNRSPVKRRLNQCRVRLRENSL